MIFESPTLGAAGVGESVPLRNLVVPLMRDVEAGIDTGIAAANTSDKPVTMIVTVRNEAGTVVAGPVAVSLETREQLAEFPNQRRLDLNLPKRFSGSLWIRVRETTGAVAFTVIRQSPGVLTTFPAIARPNLLSPFTSVLIQ